ncbi:hypothetical protein [Bradyrhizobium sp.]|uniref:hypothetical protein n=1 Tax=Bradyrhizobium sp. TaxID=376 RepID=UPI003D0CEFD4
MSDVADITLEEMIAKPREIAPAIRAEDITRFIQNSLSDELSVDETSVYNLSPL